MSSQREAANTEQHIAEIRRPPDLCCVGTVLHTAADGPLSVQSTTLGSLLCDGGLSSRRQALG